MRGRPHQPGRLPNPWLIFLDDFRDKHNDNYIRRPNELVRAAAAVWRRLPWIEKRKFRVRQQQQQQQAGPGPRQNFPPYNGPQPSLYPAQVLPRLITGHGQENPNASRPAFAFAQSILALNEAEVGTSSAAPVEVVTSVAPSDAGMSAQEIEGIVLKQETGATVVKQEE